MAKIKFFPSRSSGIIGSTVGQQAIVFFYGLCCYLDASFGMYLHVVEREIKTKGRQMFLTI